MAEIGDGEGILGNDFAMAHKLTVRPWEGAVHLPDLSGKRKEHMGERLPCTIRSVTKVRAITEETLVVRAMGPAMLAPHTVTQVRVIVPAPGARGTMMIEMGPEPLGLCPLRGVVEVEKDSSIWLANTGIQPIRIEQNEVVAMAECAMAGPRATPGNHQNNRDEVNGLVERAAPYLTDGECHQLRAAMAARKHLFATGKGDLGRTDIVQHQIHMGDQPAIKRVRRYPEGVEASGTARGRACRRARMDSPGCRPSGRVWVVLPTDGLVLYRDANSSPRSVQSSESNELPARQLAHSEASRMSGRGSYLREQVPCPKCGSRLQRQYMRKHDKNIHQGA